MNGDCWTADMETLLFFDGQPAAFPIYAAFEAAVLGMFPEARKQVRKTQITFYHRYVFACASLARVKRKSELPGPWLTVTLGLPRPPESDRIAVKCEPYPGRWTVHVVIGGAAEIDDELLGWIREAYDFSEAKGRGAGRRR